MPPYRLVKRLFSSGLGLLAFLFLAPHLVFAADKIWTGTTNSDWGTNTNWTGGKPAAGDNAVFNSTFSNQPNLGGNQSAGGIWMTGSVGQSVTISASSGVLTLQGSTINGTAGLGILVDNTNAFTLTITAAIKVGAAQTWRNNSGNLLTIGALDLNNKALTVDGTGNTLINGIVSNAGAFTKAGSGTLTLTGTNTNTGTMTVSAGVLNIQNPSALGTTASGTSVSSGAALQMQGNIAVGAEALTLNGTGISNDGALRNISGTNSYAGTITLGSATRINSDSGTLTLDVASGSAITGTQNLTFGGAGNVTVNDAIATGTGTLTKDGAGTLTLSAANTYTGLTTVTAGTLREGVSDAISTGAVTVNGATAVFDLGANHSDTVGTVTVDGGASITGTGTSTLTSTGSFEMKSGSASAILAGTGIALNKTTSGTVTLTGANTYTGGTNVSGGSLLANNTSGSATGTGAVSVTNSGSLLGGNGTITGAVSMASGTNLAPGATTASGSTAILKTGALTLSSNSNFNVDLNGTTAGSGYDQVQVTGAVGITGSNIVVNPGAGLHVGDKFFVLLNDASDTISGTFAQGATVTVGTDTFLINYQDDSAGGALGNDISLTLVTIIPEPATWVGAALTLGILAWSQRRRLSPNRITPATDSRHSPRRAGFE